MRPECVQLPPFFCDITTRCAGAYSKVRIAGGWRPSMPSWARLM